MKSVEARQFVKKGPSSLPCSADPSVTPNCAWHFPPSTPRGLMINEAFAGPTVTRSSPSCTQRVYFPEVIMRVCRNSSGYHWCLVISDTNDPQECSIKDLSWAHQSKSQPLPKHLLLCFLLINIIVLCITHIWKLKVINRFYFPLHIGRTVYLDRTLYIETEYCCSSWSLHTRAILDKALVLSYYSEVDGK